MAETPKIDIDRLVKEHVAKMTAAIEEACERMLVDPRQLGVLVEQWPAGGWRVTLSEDVEPMTIAYQQRDGTPDEDQPRETARDAT